MDISFPYRRPHTFNTWNGSTARRGDGVIIVVMATHGRNSQASVGRSR